MALSCIDCDNKATHVLVDYNHNVIDSNSVFCAEHAFEGGREQCSCCYDYTTKVDDDKGREVNLLPTYPDGALDNDGMCSEHP